MSPKFVWLIVPFFGITIPDASLAILKGHDYIASLT